MADHQEATITLPTAPTSVTAARRHVTDTLRAWGLSDGADAMDVLRLIVSELATNVVQHTFGRSPGFTVDLRLEEAERLRLGVTDSHPGRPRRQSAAAQQDHGRGLVVIRTLTAESGGTVHVAPMPDGGKTIWVEIPWLPLPAG
ncbi:hypothetical protein AN217_14975 [Streptomyces qinglanensis]|uniref:Histidine kinase/HSP90-like ATPase domain-containing protein n=1 Tax=Streptomyces qinglanensis TaxID=943816 RepID=A0A1E7K4T2_9ACTN|nr:ATP-binding protein [Streptomyces qinglanensis]OEU98909.1 hypothetical protein AN217_14975 [Streptomyces qinglanensis]OEV12632.1 hypothetical protein AN220_29900 [Streptomyces nanshensis]